MELTLTQKGSAAVWTCLNQGNTTGRTELRMHRKIMLEYRAKCTLKPPPPKEPPAEASEEDKKKYEEEKEKDVFNFKSGTMTLSDECATFLLQLLDDCIKQGISGNIATGFGEVLELLDIKK